MYGGEYGQGPGPARTSRPGWCSTSSTATGTSSRDCNPDNAFRRSGWSRASSSRPTPSRSWPRRPACPPTRSARPSSGSTASPGRGVDEDFHRGESAYDRYYGDPTNKPNPNLGEINTAAVLRREDGARRPGHQGRRPHRRATAARCATDDSVIEGLYAAGNVSSPVMGHTYPGPGGTIGPAMTFGYLAALRHCEEEARCRSISTRRWAPSCEPVEFSWTSSDVQLYHLGLGRRLRPDGQARAALPDRRHPAGAADVRATWRSQLPHDRSRRACKFPGIDIELSEGAARQRGVTGAGPGPAVGHRAVAVTAVHRHLGQGQGRGHLVGDHGDRTATAPCCGRTKRSIFARGEGGFGGERGPSTSSEPPERAPDFEIWPCRCRRSRRCCTGCAVTATRCTPIPAFAAAAGFPTGRSCTGCAPTAYGQGHGRGRVQLTPGERGSASTSSFR